MSTNLNKLTMVGASVFALVILASGVAVAGPSLGISRPYYGSSNRSSGRHAFRSYAPAFSTEARQSFSYEPAEKVAPAPAANGCHNQAAKAPPAVKKDVAEAPQATTRRSYSYEPAPLSRARSSRSAAPKKDPWLYPKGDPRRYGR